MEERKTGLGQVGKSHRELQLDSSCDRQGCDGGGDVVVAAVVDDDAAADPL